MTQDKRWHIKAEKTVRRKITMMFVTLAALILFLLGMMIYLLVRTNNAYHVILENANTAADFNSAFKETIDSRMYDHVICPRTGHDTDTLPLEDVDAAVDVLERLQKTTTLEDNQWRIRSMLNWCQSLREYMIEIAETPRYDDRMSLLDRNIRGETGLTRLIDTYMHDYLDAEVREMVRLQAQMQKRTYEISAFSGVLGALVLLVGMSYSIHLSRQIAAPIHALSENVSHFGSGELSVARVESDLVELNKLQNGIEDMAQRIDHLLKTQIEDQRSLHRAELELLQAQINPHFLYNTLDSIAILAESGDGEDAVSMVNSLSTFFRVSLSRGKDIITIGDEISHVKSYLQIQQIRYSDILKYEVNVPQEILSHPVPKLVLQPLVENALYHGIKNRRGIGRIRVSGELDHDAILLHVQDDGVGMTEEQLCTLEKGLYEDRHNGLGLANVHKRIRLYCGNEWGLSFRHGREKGTLVTVRLPANIPAAELEDKI